MDYSTSELTVTTELGGASSQSPRPDENDAVGIESHENTQADDTEDETVTMIRQPKIHPMSLEQLVTEVKTIYTGLVMLENKLIEIHDNHSLPPNAPLDVTRYLLMIPEARLILLQDRNMRPDATVWNWFFKAQKDATGKDKKPSPLESTKDLPATPGDLSTTRSTTTDYLPTTLRDCPATPEEVPAYPDVSAKTAAPQVCKPEYYLHGFLVALELRAKELEWPEYEELVARTTAEIGEEGRNKVMDQKYFLNIGYDLVDQLLRDLEAAKAKPEMEKPAPKLVQRRPLHDKSLYKKVGREQWVLVEGQWTISRTSDQWRTITGLHRIYLYEQHDFFMASQHPAASAAIKKLPTKYSMAERLWAHGIHSLLEILPTRPFETHEFMDGLIILAYSMMSLLEVTAPDFLFIWVGCKADLARHG